MFSRTHVFRNAAGRRVQALRKPAPIVHQVRMLSEAAPAKINLTLHVTAQRPDGYHLLDSLVVFAGAHDRLCAEPAALDRLAIDGPFRHGLSEGEDNLVVRAAHALRRLTGTAAGAALRLEKNLPVASGIGGGSADAAATLRLLCRLWNVNPAPSALGVLAASLGADVPVCLGNVPQVMSGMGEVLAPAPHLPPCGLVLVNPGVALATRDVFAARTGPFSTTAGLPPAWSDVAAMAACLATLSNDLEAPALLVCPVVGEVLRVLRASPNCLLARMSGSGATCFGLFDSPATAERASARLGRPGWWCWGGGLWGGDDRLYAATVRT